MSTIIIDNLFSAPVVAFVVAALATLARLDVRLPESLYPILSTLLLLSIGLKGGRALGSTDLGEFWRPLIVAVVLGIVTPLVAFGLLRVAGRMSRIDASATAAHYGSVSAVTFTVVISSLDARGTTYEGFLTAILALLEVVGIVVALALARPSGSWREVLAEVTRGRSIALLLAGLTIGAAVGADRLAPTDPLFVGLFSGVLTLFLIDMGAIAAERLRDAGAVGWRLIPLAIAIPLINGTLGALAGSLAGLSVGGTAVLATLAASASYIAAPAAVRVALPEASPGIYLTASLGITFPFNVIIGVPIYIAIAERLS